MKDRWMWNPETERILDMKYKKSYCRMDFKEIFKILAKLEGRKNALRRMASTSERKSQRYDQIYKKKAAESRAAWKRHSDSVIRDKIEIYQIDNAELRKENNEMRTKLMDNAMDITFLSEQNAQLRKIIKESDNYKEIIEKCKKYRLM